MMEVKHFTSNVELQTPKHRGMIYLIVINSHVPRKVDSYVEMQIYHKHAPTLQSDFTVDIHTAANKPPVPNVRTRHPTVPGN